MGPPEHDALGTSTLPYAFFICGYVGRKRMAVRAPQARDERIGLTPMFTKAVVESYIALGGRYTSRKEVNTIAAGATQYTSPYDDASQQDLFDDSMREGVRELLELVISDIYWFCQELSRSRSERDAMIARQMQFAFLGGQAAHLDGPEDLPDQTDRHRLIRSVLIDEASSLASVFAGNQDSEEYRKCSSAIRMLIDTSLGVDDQSEWERTPFFDEE